MMIRMGLKRLFAKLVISYVQHAEILTFKKETGLNQNQKLDHRPCNVPPPSLFMLGLLIKCASRWVMVEERWEKLNHFRTCLSLSQTLTHIKNLLKSVTSD